MNEGPDEQLARRVKAELRKRMRGLRKTAPLAACQERSREIRERLASLEVVKDAQRVALFWPIEDKHEVDLRPLDTTLRGRGVQIAYPAIDPDTGVMTFRFASPDELEEAGFGFSEPPVSAPEADELDLVVVPALAVAPTGHRLGYGAGYYDRTLPRFRPPASAVVVAFEYQLLMEVPATPTDVACDYVVTDKRVLAVSVEAAR